MYTLREVVAYATMTGCVAFMVGFLIAAYTRIFNGESSEVSTLRGLVQEAWSTFTDKELVAYDPWEGYVDDLIKRLNDANVLISTEEEKAKNKS